MAYKQLDFQKRCKIYAFWKAGYNQSQIAKEIGVHKSTISREFKRNITFVRTKLGYWTYKTHYAQTYTEDRHKRKNKRRKFTTKVEKFVRIKLEEQWSPEQISGYAKKYGLFSISHEYIYQFILKDKKNGGELYLNLRHQNKKYRKRYGSHHRREPIKNRKFIDDRPRIVDTKERVGDWEIDTIIGKDRKQAVVRIVERKSKKTILKKVNNKTAQLVADAIINGIKYLSRKVYTITGDNGSEFAYHEKISKKLNAEFYFAHPYSSWERGLNENTNGLVRQYLKKGSSFSGIDDNHLKMIMSKLNNRPRKQLDFATPNEIFKEKLKASCLI